MKYLDERIVFSVNVGYPYPDGGVYKYYVYEYDENSHSEDEEIIFVGNYYYGGTTSRVDFDVTDIIRSRIYNHVAPRYTYTTSSIEGYLVHKYRIRVWTSNDTVTTPWNDVAMVYRYPNSKGWLTNGSRTFYTAEEMVQPALQSTNYNTVNYLPHYPLQETSQYAFNQVFLTSTNIQEFKLDFSQQSFDDYYTISMSQYDSLSTLTHILLSDLVDWQGVYFNRDATLYLMMYNSQNDDYNYFPIAKFDSCKKRYYLQWKDRFGGYQSQPFGNYATFTETFDTTETQNYKNERNKSFIQIQPKWKVDSGWIPEEWYYIYESILVSPILILYDTQYDKSYYVTVNTNYTEKTYKNEKKMINLVLELEEITKQNIVY